MSLQDAVAQYLASGGKITAVPGFAGIKPMPQRKAVKKHTKKRAKADQGNGPRADWHTMIDLACELDYASTNSVRVLQAKGLIPDPCGQRGGKDVWRPEVVREVVIRVAEWKKHKKTRNLMRQAISAEAESARAFKAKVASKVASCEKKQRDKQELAQDWGELDK